MNAFFWARRKPSKELVCAVDSLLLQLFPEDSSLSLDALSLTCETSTTLHALGRDDEVPRERADSGDANLLPDEEHHCEDHSGGDEDESEQSIPKDLERVWAKIRSVFHGWDEEEVDRKRKMDRMAELLLRYRVLEKVLKPKVLCALTFETRKYVGNVFRAMTVHNLHNFVELLADRPEFMSCLVEGYKCNDTSLICGSMLRDCFEYESLTVLFLKDLHQEFALLFHITKTNANFDISADAFMNITRLLTRHAVATVPCLDESFDRIFGLLNGLLTSENYVTKRQALQLLSELLLNPVNFAVMQRYIASRDNLKLVMLLLRETSQALRMDAFHVFKIFVANPNKSEEVEHLLLRNCEKLLPFVSEFGKHETKREFLQERSLLVFTLQRMASKAEHSSGPIPLKSVASVPSMASPPTTNTLQLTKSRSEVSAYQD